ncbi:unnamed protein product [Acidithrix sp. C25]|nr:unnamed protein product [Acidithrix sp. C25]
MVAIEFMGSVSIIANSYLIGNELGSFRISGMLSRSSYFSKV